ncbi:MAG: hypothetical protein ABI835_02050 [Chloroflexota bacterium]
MSEEVEIRLGDTEPEAEKSSKTAEPSARQNRPSSSSFQNRAQEQRTVKLLNTNIYDGKYIVIDTESREAYLVPTKKLQWSTGEQSIAKSVLDTADRPYDWDQEIQSLVVTPQQIRIALWQDGAVTPEDAKSESVKSLLARLIIRGVLPVKEQS